MSSPATVPMAFTWLDARSVAPAPPAQVQTAPLLPDIPRRSVWPAVLPIALVLLVIAAYVAAALVWPLNAVRPEIAGAQVTTTAAPAASIEWPANGSASVAVQGIGTPLASTTKSISIASITKVVTALLVLDEMPLSVGEQGPSFSFTSSDRYTYQSYLANGESALNVPAGGSLTQYQMLEGMLIGSANNYADRLAEELWLTDAVFASAANQWLREHDLTGIRIVNPSGYDSANKATPEALIPLAETALANPVIAEIVAKPSVKLPGAGTVKNTNQLLADPGVVGVKTGTLKEYSVLSAKDVAVGDTTVRLYAAVLGQKSSAARFAESRDLYSQLEGELTLFPSVKAGTDAGEVTTAWGEKVEVITATDASVVLWNGGTAAATVDVNLGDKSQKGDVVGSLTVTGPLNSQKVDLKLASDVEGPSAWWRITHPIELFGLG